MAVNPNRQKLIHLNSATVKLPEGVLNKGEIAVQYANEDPALYIEKVDGSLAKFVSTEGVQGLIGSAISAATEDFIALKAEVTEQVGEVAADLSGLSAVVVTSVVVNDVTATTADGVASVTVDSDDIAVGTAITYSGETLADTTNSVTEAIQAVADKAEANEAAIATVAADSHTHDNKSVLDGITSEKVAGWDDAAASAHTHENASVLDGITSEKVAGWDDAAASAHTHANASVLDGITSEKVTAWDNAAESAHTHANASVLDGITSEKVTAWDNAAESAHTHANQSELDLIEEGDVAKWNALSGAAAVVVSARTTSLGEGILKSYDIYQGEDVVGSIDIPKDLVVTSGGIVTVSGDVKYLRLYIANQEEPVDIAVSELVDAYTEGDGIEISTGNVISAKVVEANGLSVDGSGIAMAAASAEGAGAMSSADFTKLAGIESGANVNAIEGVQVNGADLTPDANKKVNVTVTSGSTNGTIAVNGSDVEVAGLGSAAFEDATAFDAAGAAEAASAAAITTVVGDMSGDTKTLGALQAAIAESEGAVTELSGAVVSELEAIVETFDDYATSADTVAAIEAISGQFDDYATSADTVAAIEAVDGKFDDYATSADTVAAIESAEAEAITSAVTTIIGEATDTSADTTINGVIKYVDEKVAGTLNEASGDTYVNAAVEGQTIKVSATQSTIDSLALADSSIQGLTEGAESGAIVDSNNKIDFTSFGIDCGTY